MLHSLHALASRLRNGRGQAAPLREANRPAGARLARARSTLRLVRARSALPALLLLPLAGVPSFAQTPAPVPRVPVVLKLDDLTTRGGNVPHAWRRVTELAREKNIKVSIGVICDSFDHGNASYFSFIKDWHASGLVEFWFHGWDHRQWEENGAKLQEFKGTPYEHQKEHFEKSQRLAREKLGFAFTTFGSPFNGFDENTFKVFAEDADMKVFLYASRSDQPKIPGKVILERVGGVNIEDPLFVPNSQKFISGYLRHAPARGYFVIQGHPAQWNDARWAEFVKIVDFLVENQIPVVTPAELAAQLSR